MAEASTAQKIIDKIRQTDSILVAVNTSPSVDELSAALGVTLAINKLGKHATTVFSGEIPRAMEFLAPEKTFETSADSLRDFIIALDKEKADHLRYKLVDDMVKIFITPYRTTISQDDLEFSQGDFNVELVLAIGVKNESDLDKALASHGRILHDASVISLSLGEPIDLGGDNWTNSEASGYSEMLAGIVEGLMADKSNKSVIDGSIATALLTGIVAATDRFSNDRTKSKTMEVSAKLMAAGADQQLVASKLVEAATTPGQPNNNPSAPTTPTTPADNNPNDSISGGLSIDHLPPGDVDDRARELDAQRSAEAQDAAESQFAEQLAGVAPTANTSSSAVPLAEALTEDAKNNITAGPGSVKPEPNVVKSEEISEPTFGGTLNATAEQAAEDAKRALDDDRNRTILSHTSDKSGYIETPPSMQSPLNAFQDNSAPEPVMVDPLTQALDTQPTAPGIDIAPVAPAAEPPTPEPAPELSPAPEPHMTLAELEQHTRARNEVSSDARAAIDAALATGPVAPSFDQSTAPNSGLPPLPDFSTLPPLPGAPAPSPDLSVPSANLESSLPPLPTAPVPDPADPSQFHIPNQV